MQAVTFAKFRVFGGHFDNTTSKEKRKWPFRASMDMFRWALARQDKVVQGQECPLPEAC